MDNWSLVLVTAICSIIASSGFWAFLLNRSEKKDLKTRMLVGLGHDRIVYLGLKYIERGWITQDEHENLHDYLYVPYAALGGNGSAKRIIDEVNKLPICKHYTTFNKGEHNETKVEC